VLRSSLGYARGKCRANHAAFFADIDILDAFAFHGFATALLNLIGDDAGSINISEALEEFQAAHRPGPSRRGQAATLQ
jgi:hypothetical protein